MVENIKSSIRIILASGSPRRKELMSKAGYQFEVMIPESSVEEGISRSLAPVEFVKEAALRKAEAIASTIPDEAILIAADTIAECDKQILGKPIDRDDARRMLKLMSGQSHFVHTGVAVWHRPSNRYKLHAETTSLQMLEIDDSKLEKHLDSGDWVGKAGAFGFQDGLDWVSISKGYASNVVGLPVEILDDLICQLS